MINYAEGIGLKPEHVPQTCYMLWREKEIVGIFKVRHYLNDVLRNGSGHIGYAIVPEYRGRGYGRLGLRLAVNELKDLPDFAEDEIYMSCYKENTASLKIMQKNGAYIHHEDERRYFTRIPLSKKEGR